MINEDKPNPCHGNCKILLKNQIYLCIVIIIQYMRSGMNDYN